jgi:predicted nucleotide-binding protein
VGFLREVKGQSYVDLGSPVMASSAPDTELADTKALEAPTPRADDGLVKTAPGAPSAAQLARGGRVFITHGKNKEIVAQLKELLTFGGFAPIISVDNETVSKPVPDKVMDDMRSCQAAIIHVGTEMRLLDPEGKEHLILNQNVLIEVGAAMALYKRNFILLVEKGVTLPSNLQGLYQVRYEGEKLEYESTMRLLKAFNDFRT